MSVKMFRGSAALLALAIGVSCSGAALAQQPSREFEVRASVIGVQLESALVCGLGVAPLPLFLIYISQQVMCSRNRRI